MTCSECSNSIKYQDYWVTVGSSGPFFVYKCNFCGNKQYELLSPNTRFNTTIHEEDSDAE